MMGTTHLNERNKRTRATHNNIRRSYIDCLAVGQFYLSIAINVLFDIVVRYFFFHLQHNYNGFKLRLNGRTIMKGIFRLRKSRLNLN